MIHIHKPTEYQLLRDTVISHLSNGMEPAPLVQWVRNYDIHNRFKVGLIAEILFFVKSTDDGLELEWAPDLCTNVDFHVLRVPTNPKIDVTTNLYYKKMMLMSGYLAVSQDICFAEVRFANDAFIGSTRSHVLLTKPTEEMMATVEFEFFTSKELASLEVFNQLVWEVGSDGACPIIRKRMKVFLAERYHREINEGLVSHQGIDEMLSKHSKAIFDHIVSNGSRRCFTEIEIHAYLDELFADDWDYEKQWGTLSKLMELEAQIKLREHISNYR